MQENSNNNILLQIVWNSCIAALLLIRLFPIGMAQNGISMALQKCRKQAVLHADIL